MKPIKLSHEHDPDMTITLALPNGQAGEDAFAEFVNTHARGNKYQADFARALSSPKMPHCPSCCDVGQVSRALGLAPLKRRCR